MSKEDVEKKIEELRCKGFSPETVEEMKGIIRTSDGLKFLRSKAAKDEAVYEQALAVSVGKIVELLITQEGQECIEQFHGAMQQFDQQARELGDDGLPVIVLTNLARLGWMAVWQSLASRSVQEAEELAAGE
jgi:hypothetical protein